MLYRPTLLLWEEHRRSDSDYYFFLHTIYTESDTELYSLCESRHSVRRPIGFCIVLKRQKEVTDESRGDFCHFTDYLSSFNFRIFMAVCM